MKAIACSLLLALVAHKAQAGLSGGQVITPENYPDFGGFDNNPPFCGMPYSSLDLNRVTAVQDGVECGACIEVCGDNGCVSVLVIDQGGQGLDLSTGAFGQIFGQADTPAYATWNPVDGGNCDGIQH